MLFFSPCCSLLKSSVSYVSPDVRDPRTCCHQRTLHPFQDSGPGDPTEQDHLRNQPAAAQQRGGKGLQKQLTQSVSISCVSRSVRNVFVMLRWSGGTRAECKTWKIVWSSPTAPTEACRTTSSSLKPPMPMCLETWLSAAHCAPPHQSDWQRHIIWSLLLCWQELEAGRIIFVSFTSFKPLWTSWVKSSSHSLALPAADFRMQCHWWTEW